MKSLFCFCLAGLLFLNFTAAQAQTNSTSVASNAPTRLNHIALHVNDLKKSTSFYENFLQLQQIPEPFHDGLHTWFTVGEKSHLHLIQGKARKTVYDKGEHLCFSVASVEDFIGRLNKANVKFENWVGKPQEYTLRTDGVKQVYFQDPDGHWIEVNDAKE
ncbi:VOC family protein [Adhaeribacter swui]|uniref:VOC family protein n=1 Tax=Adhaeribacter swui TaxID=2086471 RepID=A0A7G7G4G4_9BACT|nr:VOC family protein [Adhaeribacter swui]QNF32048.1 VOC family protein [Adhaeribacter swui]